MCNRPISVVFASVDMALPKGESFHLVRILVRNTSRLRCRGRISTLEQAAELFAGVSYFASLDRLQGFWQIPMHMEAEEALRWWRKRDYFPLTCSAGSAERDLTLSINSQ